VLAVVAALAALAGALAGLERWQAIGGMVAAVLSSSFLIAVAVTNMGVLVQLYRHYRRPLRLNSPNQGDEDVLPNGRGLLARLLKPVFGLVGQSWHMFPVGVLFGLGFDTATEVATFGLAATQASKGLPIGDILVLPVLFAAGMSLVDTCDGLMMLGVYNWAFVKPARKVYYNIVITLASVVLALFIGGLGALSLIADQFGLTGRIWENIGLLNDHLNLIGLVVIGLFAAGWAGSFLLTDSRRPSDGELPLPNAGRPSP